MEDKRPYKIPAPKDLEEYILRKCAKEGYLIFSKKHSLIACTRCGAEFPLKRMNWIRRVPSCKRPTGGYYATCPREICPKCGAHAIPKDIRYGRKCLMDLGRVVWTRAYGAVTFIEVDEFIINYEMPHPGVTISPVELIRMDAKSQKRWDYDWYSGKWYQVKTIGLRAAPQNFGLSEWHDHLYSPDGKTVQYGTDLQYANMDLNRFGFADRRCNSWQLKKMIQYMSDFMKYQAIEILEKSGFRRLVDERSTGLKTRRLNLRAKDLRKILKVNGAEVKKLREQEPGMKMLEDLHRIRELAPWAKIEDIEDLNSICGYVQERKIQLIRRHADTSKVLRRLLEEMRATGDAIKLSDYADYLEAVYRLGRRLDKKTLYPANFWDAHDEAVTAAEEMKGELDAKDFARYQKDITGMTDPFVLGPLLIRPAKSPQELNRESRVLNHCVRTYANKVAMGATSILFIRKTAEPNRPYYTLELDCTGRVVQCRGDHNKTYPDDVAAFIKEWMKWREKERRTT